MNSHILQPEIQQFIREYKGELATLAFKGSPFLEVTTQELLQQIEGHHRSKSKLPTWHQTPGIYYPKRINLEQASSEQTALYKSKLIRGKVVADLTGGLGVDSFYFSKNASSVFHYELDLELSEVVAHNFSVLKANQIECINADGLDAIQSKEVDTLFLDPSRRTTDKGKVFMLGDMEPNIVPKISELLQVANEIWIKTSPLLDLQQGLTELQSVSEIHVVAVNNEVKELLWKLEKSPSSPLKTVAVNLHLEQEDRFEFESSQQAKLDYGFPTDYLYEPNAALLKAGGQDHYGAKLNLKKLHPNSHLYTGEQPDHFYGRQFKIKEVYPYGKSAMQKWKNQKANVTTRNFKETVADLRKRWKIKDGGSYYLFFTTNHEQQQIVIACEKV